jgi:CMP-N,N'-diacetyllegionaminic acid synthase
MRVLGLITARGGSKGLPGKNILDFKGKPLIVWSIQQAIACKLISKVIVSTDDERIAEVSKKSHAEIPFMRPAQLATDEASSLDVALHALDYFEARGEAFDILVLLQPTSPLRRTSDLDRLTEGLIENWETVDASILVAPFKPSPSHAFNIINDRLVLSKQFQNDRRQNLTDYYASYGLGWAIKTKTLRSEKTFYPNRNLAIIIKKEQAVDIDDQADFKMASCMYDFLGKEFFLG